MPDNNICSSGTCSKPTTSCPGGKCKPPTQPPKKPVINK